MIRSLPNDPQRILKDGVLCYIASPHPAGPHVTPVVYAVHDSRAWVTTSRGSVKARTWKREPRVGGLVRANDRAVVFAGRVETFDLLDPTSWPRSLVHAPTLTRATVAFSTKNARFFAGYAVDALHVPLAWTPPGRVFAAIEIERIASIHRDGVQRTWGRFGRRIPSADAFRAMRARPAPLDLVPDRVRERLGDSGDGVLGIDARRGPVTVVPCRWTEANGALFASLPAEVLALASPGGVEVPVSLTVDHASQWRARAMTGLLAQGHGRVHRVASLGTGRRSAERIAERAGIDPRDAAVVAVHPRRLVWWSGWDSATVRVE